MKQNFDENEVIRIVLTGGPSSGKTAIYKLLREKFGSRAIFSPEAALVLANGGFPMPRPELPWSYDWQVLFQDAVFNLQINLEEVCNFEAKATNTKVIVFDRGILDGAAYFRRGLEEFEQRYSVDSLSCLSRYSTVIHLDSIANYGQKYFDKFVGTEKFHNFKQSLEYDKRSYDVWSGHRELTIVHSKDIEEKKQIVIETIENIINPNTLH